MPPDSRMPTKKINVPFLLRFGFVGGTTAILCLGLTFGLVEFFGVSATIASTFSLFLAVCYNYLLHYHWTFTSDAPHGYVLIKYLVMCAGGLLLNALIMHFGVTWGALHYMIVQMFAAVMVILWSMCVSSIWVFR